LIILDKKLGLTGICRAMSHLIHKFIQQALYTLLNEDSTLGGIVSGVYDNPPEQQHYPYIVINSLASRDWSTRTSVGFSTTIPLTVYGQSGTQQVLDILDRIYELLVEGNLSLLEHQLVAMHFETHDVRTEGDGVTQSGEIRFRAYSESVPV
ncbi:MAG: DUF3168 domain-containing protein, partial [Rickettsiales bacterium]|nr:DUF3168 domain-containing protein [Rickettsiales bacterium]